MPPIKQTGEAAPAHYSAQPAPGQELKRVEIPHQQHGGATIMRGTDTKPIEPDRAQVALWGLIDLTAPDLRNADLI
jgi:hypothetical protein